MPQDDSIIDKFPGRIGIQSQQANGIDEVITQRVILPLLATFTLLLRYIFMEFEAVIYDPVIARIAFSTIFLTGFVLTYTPFFKRFNQSIVYPVYYLYTFYSLYLVIQNFFVIHYVLGLVLLIAIIALSFREQFHLRLYLLSFFILFVLSAAFEMNNFLHVFQFSVLFGVFVGFIYLFFDYKIDNQNQLELRENFLNTIFHKSPDAYLLIDPDSFTVKDFNNRSKRLFELGNSGDLRGYTFNQLLDNPYPAEDLRNIQQMIHHDGQWEDELELKTLKHNLFWGDVAFIQFKVEEQMVWLVRVSDITEKKLAEKSIYESEAKYKTLMEEASDGIYLADIDGNIVDANPKACELFGYSLRDFLQLNIKNLIVVSGEDEISDDLPQFDEGATLFERRFVRSNGEVFTAELSAKLLEDGKHQAILRDITERKKFEKKLWDNERKFRSLIENASEVITVLDPEGKVLFISSSVERILSYDYKYLIGKGLDNIIIDDDKHILKEKIAALPEETGSREYVEEIRLVNASGETRYFEVFVTNMLHDHVIQGYVVNLHNITRRKETENELKKTNFELDSFVYKASHDLKAPLRSLLGLINLAEKETEDEQQLQYLGMMEKSINNLNNFIQDLTSFSRESRLEVKPEKVDIEYLINEIIENIKYQEGYENIRVEQDININDVFYSDLNRINTILNNIISNAYKYHRNDIEDPYIEVNIQVDSNDASIEIIDNGQGIEEEYINKIFDMFYRASESGEGSGLGLYIVKNAVEKLNGKINVNSKPDEGTKFFIKLPNLKNANSE